MKSLIRFLSSVKLAITLIIIIVIVSILGTLIPQGRSAAEYADRYGSLAGWLMRLRFTDLYHSAWYIALLSLLALNTVVCTLTRLGPKLRKTFRPNLEAEAKALLALKDSARFSKKLGLEDRPGGRGRPWPAAGSKSRSRPKPAASIFWAGKEHWAGSARTSFTLGCSSFWPGGYSAP